MVKRRKVGRKTRVKTGYKKCIVATMRRIKFKTPKAARKAFTRAGKMCSKKLAAGKKVAGKRKCKNGRRKGSKKCRKTPAGKKTRKRKCKYGRIKGGKRCRKTPRR